MSFPSIPYFHSFLVDVPITVEIALVVNQKFSLVVSISSKSFQPTSMQLSFQVIRINHAFKPKLGPFGIWCYFTCFWSVIFC